MPQDKVEVRTNVFLSTELHTRVKVRSAEQRERLRDTVADLIERGLDAAEEEEEQERRARRRRRGTR